MTADRDDLAAILGRIFTYSNPSIYVDEDIEGDTFRIGDVRFSTRAVAAMVFGSDWLRDEKADAWDEGRFAEADARGDVPLTHSTGNPYRADRVDAEDGGR